ncbi:glycosyltransferase [uncultured Limnohabitans sp.]|jgi:glucosyl-3-phosphoglycerate synthase|uniref:glycosyltransferase n=1 Tax=uncultured Limnohabitans sp. TaxID=768543 RepID=UPI00260362D0|nr:glycosyltransferase [uncultured Limnohabitans sp.]
MRYWQRIWQWLSRRTSDGQAPDSTALAAMPTAQPPKAQPAPPLVPCVSVIIPALNEQKRIADVVRYALSDSATAEVIVVDDSSTDNTVTLAREAGASVVTSSLLGKGASMADGALLAQSEIVVYLDGDLKGLRKGIISDLARPLIASQAEFVKARFGRGGGRVTELTAKPMLKVFFPEIAHFSQPLGGIIGARKTLLQQLTFEDGYGVDVGLLIDAWRANAKLAEVDIGHLEHNSQPLLDLTSMANEISRVIYSRARESGRLHVEQITAMYESQRQATASWDYAITRQKNRQKLLLLDMDGTVTTSRFATLLAQATGQVDELNKHLDGSNPDVLTRSASIAQIFRFVHRQKFESVAKAMPIRPGVIECVKAFKRAGFMVGVVSDSYFVAAEILRKRIFADFALAHTVQFQGDVCTGELSINSAFMADSDTQAAATQSTISKQHVVRQFRHPDIQPRFEDIWAVGDNENDIEMLRLADKAWMIEPKSPRMLNLEGVVQMAHFDELTAALAATLTDAGLEAAPTPAPTASPTTPSGSTARL